MTRTAALRASTTISACIQCLLSVSFFIDSFRMLVSCYCLAAAGHVHMDPTSGRDDGHGSDQGRDPSGDVIFVMVKDFIVSAHRIDGFKPLTGTASRLLVLAFSVCALLSPPS